MKGHALLYLCFLLVFCAFGHKKDMRKKDIPPKDISGTYYNESGFKIEIIGDEFNYIVTQPRARFWSIDTLAKCTFKWINDSFIELNTPRWNIIGKEGFKVVQSLDTTSSLDSIKLSFIIPYQRDLQISVFTRPIESLYFLRPQTKREFVIRNTFESFSFGIAPVIIKPHTANCLFYGAIEFDPLGDFQIEKNINHISIELPALDDAFFERFFFEGDYAKVSENTITWKGEVFRKE